VVHPTLEFHSILVILPVQVYLVVQVDLVLAAVYQLLSYLSIRVVVLLMVHLLVPVVYPVLVLYHPGQVVPHPVVPPPVQQDIQQAPKVPLQDLINRHLHPKVPCLDLLDPTHPWVEPVIPQTQPTGLPEAYPSQLYLKMASRPFIIHMTLGKLAGPPTIVIEATVGMVLLVVDSTHLVDTHTVGEPLPDTLTVSQVNLVVSVRALD